MWRELDRKIFETTINTNDIPDNIKDVQEDVLKELIECKGCKKAYRIIAMELNFLRQLGIPVPRFCVDCRFASRHKFVPSPVFKEMSCMCVGEGSKEGVYQNNNTHGHSANDKCLHSFKTAYDVGTDIVYCETCYQKEVL